MFHASPCPTGVALGVQAAQRSRLQDTNTRGRNPAVKRRTSGPNVHRLGGSSFAVLRHEGGLLKYR